MLNFVCTGTPFTVNLNIFNRYENGNPDYDIMKIQRDDIE